MMVEKLHLPIPYLAAAGQFLEVIFYWLMVIVPNKTFSMVCSTLLWVSYSMSTPAPISIVSVGLGRWLEFRPPIRRRFRER